MNAPPPIWSGEVLLHLLTSGKLLENQRVSELLLWRASKRSQNIMYTFKKKRKRKHFLGHICPLVLRGCGMTFVFFVLILKRFDVWVAFRTYPKYVPGSFEHFSCPSWWFLFPKVRYKHCFAESTSQNVSCEFLTKFWTWLMKKITGEEKVRLDHFLRILWSRTFSLHILSLTPSFKIFADWWRKTPGRSFVLRKWLQGVDKESSPYDA